MIAVTAAFDGGNIAVHDIRPCADGTEVRLSIVKDAGTDFHQWFHFRVAGGRGDSIACRIEGAGSVSYPAGFRDYRAVVSDDGEDWVRTETDFDGDTLTIHLNPRSDMVFVAFFAPYGLERQAAFLARLGHRESVKIGVAGETLDGRDLDLVTLGDADADRPALWIIGRQHAGEPMASWWMEGFLTTVSDPSDRDGQALRERARLFVVPNVNPDGTARGHLRGNAVGTDLNRAWSGPDPATAPEIHAIRSMMHRTGVAFFLDVHGDEALPYCFVAGMAGVPGLSDSQGEGEAAFQAILAENNPDFQTEHGYPRARPGEANLRIASKHVAHAFGAVAMTLEMPFKDAANNPEPVRGWSPDRCRALGRDCARALAEILPRLER